MWRKYFIVVKVVPGRIKTPRHGIIDLSRDDLNVATLKELYEEDWPYILITNEGMKELYGSAAVIYPELVPEVAEIGPDVMDPADSVTETPVFETPVAPKRKTSRKREL
jgi:hypothetical protein